jgi:hypothetical protein
MAEARRTRRGVHHDHGRDTRDEGDCRRGAAAVVARQGEVQPLHLGERRGGVREQAALDPTPDVARQQRARTPLHQQHA